MEIQEMLGKVENLIKEQSQLHKSAIDEQKTLGKSTSEKLESLEKRAEDLEKFTTAYNDIKAATDELKVKSGELEAKQKDLERFGLNRPDEYKSLGERFLDSTQFKEMRENKWEVSRKFDVGSLLEQKDIISSGSTQLTPPQRIAGVNQIPNVPLTVRVLLPVGRTANNNIEYVRENAFTNNAGPQYSPASPTNFFDGAKKNKSDLSWTLVNTPIRTIAHYMKASRQILDDAPMLQSEINNRLLYGLALEEEEELLLGDGTNGNILGLIPQATAYNVAYNVGGDTKIDKLRHALLQVTLSKYLPTAIVLNPRDWHDIELVKTTQGSYIMSNPAAQTDPRLWGYRVVPSLSIPYGTFLVGNFTTGAQIFDRMNATVEVARQNEDDFIRNMVSILAEERIALAVYNSGSFVQGTL